MSSWARLCPHAEAAGAEILSLPMDPLMADDDVDLVCGALLDTLARR